MSDANVEAVGNAIHSEYDRWRCLTGGTDMDDVIVRDDDNGEPQEVARYPQGDGAMHFWDMLFTALGRAALAAMPAATNLKGDSDDLSRNHLVDLDHARLALFDAIGKIKIGNPTDDKLILDNLREAGFWICRIPDAPAPSDQEKIDTAEIEWWLGDAAGVLRMSGNTTHAEKVVAAREILTRARQIGADKPDLSTATGEGEA